MVRFNDPLKMAIVIPEDNADINILIVGRWGTGRSDKGAGSREDGGEGTARRGAPPKRVRR